ncbi:acyl-CoA/acyl-ACP dehydrogenase [Saccharopolyspora sp. NFXS83]|uniref:acyl-CoA dehydrogenase family protein n=1 Tax=Saccharopolyspora sp. NFXS83 TaxID=2993560 RepID=UPI00224AA87C|nr:acyl-CoA dehydrogenase family protein [Saccharopolyspora sp. NFXS83]MCX2730420.1 acyl-CoA/acyl-ACP dehydrogenase [Saccharopolyspora sp. NFXS83]
MDFAPTEGQHDLAELTRDIVTDHVTADRLRDVESGPDRFDRALWTELGKAGVLDAALPEALGGGGCGLPEQCAVLVELGRAVTPVPYLPSLVTGASAVVRFGDARQHERWARPAGDGEIVLTAAFAEGADPAPAAPSTTAERDGAKWRVNGVKVAVPAGAVADFFLVPASTPHGRRVFVVAADDGGVAVRRQQIVDGDSEAWLELSGVGLDDDRLLGGDEAADVADWLEARGTLGLCAEQLGVLERALELTAEYAGERTQFDRPIGTFQAVSQRLADAYIDVEAVRLTMWQAAWRAAEGLRCDAEVATAKFWAAEAGHRVAHTAVHVHGGVGIDLEHHLHRYFVAAKRREFALGGATAQLHRIGTALADDGTLLD